MLSATTALVTGVFAASALIGNLKAALTCDPDNGGLKLPQGFCALVVADNLGAARHLVVTPSGDVFVALQGTGDKGGVVALRDTKGDGRLDLKEHFGQGSLTGIALRNGYLYIAGFNTVQRYRMTLGQLKPTGEAEVVVSGLPGVRQRGDKGIAFDGKGSLYVNVGAPSNACQSPDRRRKGERVESKTNAGDVIFLTRSEGFQIVNSDRPPLRSMPRWRKTKPT
jgi:glucose/arabinose dehydrogenase